ncbi:MAG: SPASM domain-containing protein [Bryobacterales bacterium]|jgi:hypothetical protein|nr:SPASM domain-containing protein [Bryobacterales bacterium]
MESIYFVICYLCHRTCVHCYEDRFRPYHGEDLAAVIAQSRETAPRVIANLPERLSYLDWDTLDAQGRPTEHRGRIILAGGEVLLDAVREPVLYPAIRQLQEKYRHQGGVDILVQTTGDVLTEKILDELLALGVRSLSIAGLDAYHKGLDTPEAQERLRSKLLGWFVSRGMMPSPEDPKQMAAGGHQGRQYFHFFGATPDSWIGPLWPRGRALQNELSVASMGDNFCNRWSGGLGFLDYRNAGSEVSIEPDGNVYPCCLKTKLPLGNVAAEALEAILQRHVGNPVYEAISMGHPERMGIAHGWSVERFLQNSMTTLPSGKPYRNLCVGCDRFHEEVLGAMSSDLVSISMG